MEYNRLGNSGLTVSRICFGALVIGPLQLGFSEEEGGEVIREALDMGINFIDTAQLYQTYPHIRYAIRKSGITPVISTKCYAYSREDAAKAVEEARRMLDMDVIDIFMMHEQESRLTLEGHREALDYYLEAKEKGIIRATGVSTHNVEVCLAAADMEGIDVIHPLINMTGVGIGDGGIQDMLKAVEYAHGKGKGIYSMKALGGGTLISRFKESMEFILNIPFIDSVAIGMQSSDEVHMNLEIFEKGYVDDEMLARTVNGKKKLHVDFWCTGCGQCVKRCNQNALKLVDGKAEADGDRCILCGYCAPVCPEFAIKIC